MPATQPDPVLIALQEFARQVQHHTDLAQAIPAHLEDQLKAPVITLVKAVGESLDLKIDILTESPVEDVGRPDLAIAVDGLLVGYIELKAPGEGTTTRELNPHNRLQFKRFEKLPNLIYTDARDWTLYHEGKRENANDLRLGPIDETGDTDLDEVDASKLREMLRTFLYWEPTVPANPRQLAEVIAPLTRLIREDVAQAVTNPDSALSSVYEDWKRTLFPEATPDEFADSYAQTLTYGLLLARLDGSSVLDPHQAAQTIEHHSSLLSRTLDILTQSGTQEELGVGLDLLERTVEAVNPSTLRTKMGDDPWLYFYEDFLAVYDPKLRNERGVYYTPAPVVKAQVTLVDELLRTRLDIPDGVAGPEVTVLDPAVGTGTYLLEVLQRGVDNVAKTQGPGAVSPVASRMAKNLYGFELLVGPYAVAHVRLSQAIRQHGGQVPDDGVHIYLADTLEAPNTRITATSSYYEKPLAEERRRARDVKDKTEILVCLGNPPYEREQSDTGEEHQMGRWIRFGHEITQGEWSRPLLRDFSDPVKEAGAGVHTKNLYNLYVYFWRWALWKVFETQNGPGIVSFISASSYLRGPGFVGMREELRRTLDEIWILDLQGDSRGTRTSENVFDIRTPVAIAVGVRYGEPDRAKAAKVHYAKITGTRAEKYSVLNELSETADVDWSDGFEGWQEPLTGKSEGDFFGWPTLVDLMPWAQSGVKIGRTWVVAELPSVLGMRAKSLVSEAVSKRMIFKDSPTGRKVDDVVTAHLGNEPSQRPVVDIQALDEIAKPVQYAYRSFDHHWIIADYRFIDRPGPALWQSISNKQLFLTSLFEHPLGAGPAITFSVFPPDLHHFRGSYGGKDTLPLFRDSKAEWPNTTNGLLTQLTATLNVTVTPEALAAFIAAVLAHPNYTARFHDELEVPGPRVPLTKDPALFQRAVELGKQVIAWQTYAERFPEAIGTTKGHVPPGAARLQRAIPGEPDKYPNDLSEVSYNESTHELKVGEGLISNVDPRVWHYEVSGLHVVRSWLGYRMKNRSGRKSSPLDDIRPERWTHEMTEELLDLLWVLEGVIALEPAQAQLLDEIVAGPLFLASELPTPTDEERKPPKIDKPTTKPKQAAMDGL